MAKPERVIEELVGRAIERAAQRASRHRHRRRRRGRGTFGRVVRAILLMMLATFVLVPMLIGGGFFYGALKGLIAAPLILIAVWGAILAWSLRRKPVPKLAADAPDMSKLPGRTEEWLEEQRALLPSDADSSIESLLLQLETLAPQLEGLDPQQPAAVELRRLLAEELPELVRGYQRVPRKLQRQAALGGSSPERQLVDGLATIDQQLAKIHERLAAEDLRALATHKRYLELKYKGDKLE